MHLKRHILDELWDHVRDRVLWVQEKHGQHEGVVRWVFGVKVWLVRIGRTIRLGNVDEVAFLQTNGDASHLPLLVAYMFNCTYPKRGFHGQLFLFFLLNSLLSLSFFLVSFLFHFGDAISESFHAFVPRVIGQTPITAVESLLNSV